VPVLADLAITGTRRVFAYLAADAFYYLQVARQWGEHGRVSFDGERSTNGFHPLWQATLAALDAIGLRGTTLMVTAVVLGVALTATAVVLLAGTLVAARSSGLPALFVLLPLGAYGLLLAPLWAAVDQTRPDQINPFEGPVPLYGTLWSAANGMETGAVVAAFALTAWLFVTGRSPWLIGAAMSLLVVARLDCGLVVASLLLTQLLWSVARRDRDLRARALASGAVLAAPVAVYLVWNRIYAGAALPVSGTLKSTFPRPVLGNWRDLVDLAHGKDAFLLLRAYRQAPILVSAIAAIAWLAGAARRSPFGDPASATVRWRVVLMATAVGVLLIDCYDFFFVPGGNQGHWYFPLQVLFVSLVALEWLAGWRAVDHPVAAALAIAVSAVAFLAVGHPDHYHQRFAAFWYDEAADVRAFYGDQPPKLLSADDGIDVYSLGFPAMSAFGLMIDADAVDAIKDGRLVPLAYDRGYDRISSLAYADGDGLTVDSPPEDVRAWVARLLGRKEDLSGFTFTVEYASDPFPTPMARGDGRYLIVRVTTGG
jgi:hypothetical protein